MHENGDMALSPAELARYFRQRCTGSQQRETIATSSTSRRGGGDVREKAKQRPAICEMAQRSPRMERVMHRPVDWGRSYEDTATIDPVKRNQIDHSHLVINH
jgi:hypothetical protein